MAIQSLSFDPRNISLKHHRFNSKRNYCQR